MFPSALNDIQPILRENLWSFLQVCQGKAPSPPSNWKYSLNALALEISQSLESESLMDNYQPMRFDANGEFDPFLVKISRVMELRDREIIGHTYRVTKLTLQLSKAIGVSEQELVNIHIGSLLHDIGKMAIPDDILKKPGPLTEIEWQIMRQHPTLAYELLSSFPKLRPALHIPYCHHEKWDGTGYPRGLIADQIPLAARIFTLADVWDALTSDRPYRLALTPDQATRYIIDQEGCSFDPVVVNVFQSLVESSQWGR